MMLLQWRYLCLWGILYITLAIACNVGTMHLFVQHQLTDRHLEAVVREAVQIMLTRGTSHTAVR
jgi:hypothetical protein